MRIDYRLVYQIAIPPLNQPIVSFASEIVIGIAMVLFVIYVLVYLFRLTRPPKKIQQREQPVVVQPPEEEISLRPPGQIRMGIYDNNTNNLLDFGTYDSLSDVANELIKAIPKNRYAKVESDDFIGEVRTMKQAEQFLKVTKRKRS